MLPAQDLLTELKPSIAELCAIDLRSNHQFEEENYINRYEVLAKDR
jgi:hypothetical protein